MAKNNKPKLNKKQLFNSAIKDYDKLINWDSVFPRSGRPDLRKKPTRHQLRKLNELNEILTENGGAKRFHPVKRSRKRDIMQAATGTEKIFKGYFAQGEMRISGEWAVLDIKAANVELYYRGFSRNPLSPEEAAEFTRQALINKPHVKITNVGLSNKGGQFDMVGIKQQELLIDKARATYSKYAEMAKNKLKRKNYHNQLAAHPKHWMTGIAFTRQT